MSASALNTLLTAAAQGDAHAFQKLYEQAAPRLFALCLHMLHRDYATAEDVLQEVFIKIWNRAQSFDPDKASAMTWMTTILRHQVIDHLRFVGKRPVLDGELEFETLDYADEGMQPQALHELDEATGILQAALDKLPDNYRECLLQSFYHGYSHGEIAERLSAPLGTVKAWIRRGGEQVKQECLQVLAV